MPGPTFGFVKLLASSGSHCTKWADEQQRQAGFESRLVPNLPLPFIPTLIGLRAFDLVSSRVWWEAATNTWLHNIQGAHANSCYHTSAYTLHADMLPSSWPPTLILMVIHSSCRLHDASDHASSYNANKAIYAIFLLRIPASCLL